ncbi:hypothetical protein ACKVMT_05760 [Halobacteriales archaeon Cl-PHB]
MRLSKTDEDNVQSTIGSAVLQAVGIGREGDGDGVTQETGRGTEETVTGSASVERTETVEETATAEQEATETEGLPLDQVFEILKNQRRREVLHYLNEHEGQASLSDLAEHIAAMENDTTVDAISSSQRKRVYVGLYQCHLPKMDDMNIVAFDQNRGDVELAANAEQLDAYLTDTGSARRWHRVYLGLAVAAGLLVGVGELGAAAYGLSPMLVMAGFLVVTVLFAGYQTYQVEFVDED